jgi:hypothetical protein
VTPLPAQAPSSQLRLPPAPSMPAKPPVAGR